MYKRILTIILVYIPAGFVVASILLVTLLKWVPVTMTPLMVKRSIESIGGPHRPFQRIWVPLESISNNMICAVIAAEDQKFLHHHGFDYDELSKMKQEYMFDGPQSAAAVPSASRQPRTASPSVPTHGCEKALRHTTPS